MRSSSDLFAHRDHFTRRQIGVEHVDLAREGRRHRVRTKRRPDDEPQTQHLCRSGTQKKGAPDVTLTLDQLPVPSA
jgi:hypothetical protein